MLAILAILAITPAGVLAFLKVGGAS